MQIQLIRHATIRVSLKAHTFLVDPMLSPKDAMDTVQNAASTLRNPLCPLPFSSDEILKDVNAVLVTHTHRDHWDDAATQSVPKALPIICQPEDASKFRDWGYTDVRPVTSELQFDTVAISRTNGQHGTGDIAKQMAPVSGFVLRDGDSRTLYIAGDTIYCPEVESALTLHRPDFTVVNAGAAQFKTGGPITMASDDVARVCRFAPETQVIAVHMEAINHCLLRRDELRRAMAQAGLEAQVLIPGDGRTLEFD